MKKQVKNLKLTKEELNLLDGILESTMDKITSYLSDEIEEMKEAIPNQKACQPYSQEYNGYNRVIETHEFFIDKYSEELDMLNKIRVAVVTAMYR